VVVLLISTRVKEKEVLPTLLIIVIGEDNSTSSGEDSNTSKKQGDGDYDSFLRKGTTNKSKQDEENTYSRRDRSRYY